MNLRSKLRFILSRHSRCWIPEFDATQSIFIHVPKSAGTSISLALYGKDPWHYRLADYSFLVRSDFRRFFKFAFVRNPYDRLLSTYLYSFKQVVVNPNTAVRFVTEFPSFEGFVTGWVSARNVEGHYFFYPQAKYIATPHAGMGIDFIGRFERLEEDFRFVARRLGINESLPRTNLSAHEHFSRYYTGEMAEVVRKAYQADFRMFDYDDNPFANQLLSGQAHGP